MGNRQRTSRIGKSPLLAVALLLGAFALGIAVWYGWTRFGSGIHLGTKSKNTTTVASTNSSETSFVLPPQPQQATDADRDGLTDEEEASLSTNPKSADSDSDGLSDSAEVKVYNTNPLVADTDKDEKLDGEEVQTGSDPNGPGTLLDVAQAIENLKTTNTP
ncbi:MAG: hypothetical protein V1778_04790 [bacterium]